MTREDKCHYAKKHLPGARVDEKIAEAVRSCVQKGRFTCASAFEIARKLSVPPIEVGHTADLLKIRISKCQLGLFGYGSPKKIVKSSHFDDQDLEKAIQKGVVNDRLPCATAFKIAGQFGITRRKVTAACERLGIKISSCQLGAF
jgi:hypothetical protein